jgi:hypothetical protein
MLRWLKGKGMEIKFGQKRAPKLVVGGIVLALVASVGRFPVFNQVLGFDWTLVVLVLALLLTGVAGWESIATAERVSAQRARVSLGFILLLELAMWASGTLLLPLFMVPILIAFRSMMADRVNARIRQGFILMGIGPAILLIPAVISPWLLFASFFPAALVEVVGLSFLFAIGVPVPPKSTEEPAE